MLLAMRVPFPDEILRSSLLLLVFATCIVVTAALQLRAHLTDSRWGHLFFIAWLTFVVFHGISSIRRFSWSWDLYRDELALGNPTSLVACIITCHAIAVIAVTIVLFWARVFLRTTRRKGPSGTPSSFIPRSLG